MYSLERRRCDPDVRRREWVVLSFLVGLLWTPFFFLLQCNWQDTICIVFVIEFGKVVIRNGTLLKNRRFRPWESPDRWQLFSLKSLRAQKRARGSAIVECSKIKNAPGARLHSQ